MTLRRISVIGLGYVGLPVAVAFGKIRTTIGFDINQTRLNELRQGYDRTREVDAADLQASDIIFTSDVKDLAQADFHIVTVPTPVNHVNQPDFTPLEKASQTVGSALKKGDIVVYESTVYPGATEEICIPILEKVSGLTYGKDFTVGYSPERINPGDKDRTFTKIMKVVSGSDQATLDIVADVYGSVVTAGIFKAATIKVAEAAKVIENTQRDINIALMNELALIFNRLDIDTVDVLEAAGTKWNFLPFRPGLVGGHCIGVDPYYLAHKAQETGYNPKMILAGRHLNNGMGQHIGREAIKALIQAGKNPKDSVISILGLTFKENCPDIRNTKVVDILAELDSYGVSYQICDPEAEPAEAKHEYEIQLMNMAKMKPADLTILAVAHTSLVEQLKNASDKLLAPSSIVIDVKSCLDRKEMTDRGYRIIRL
ncbi:nucleotide sugar dehydrogenase [Candidatus Odyssella acanthamoebae]|uniref:GDP-mannose dehydrogenase n=1 Tax=Candidatus Odyssella acanthamoebae TaxID=91604 RepID=A0A077AYF1_9PROT|nr:nucleotide sugar dehydrogenase [Candidatus Paracaedibacter acanthamoebae]AIK97009.1 GDP-mannose dehydrogenase [Candidatus Paracaedibacter acanthamoebae]